MRVPGFKQIIIYFFTSLILFTSCIKPTQINKSDRPKPAIEADKFDQRLSDLHQRIETVAASLQQAEGLARTAGMIDLQVAKYFAEYIAWELDHPDIIKEALAANDIIPGQETLTPEQRDQRYLEHINRELTDAMVVLEQAMQRLEEDDFRPVPEPIRWKDMVYKDGNFRVDERIVFPGGFTLLGWDFVDRNRYPEWSAEDEAASRGYLTEMRDMGVGTDVINITVPGLITDQRTVDPGRISQQMEYIKSFEDKGLKVGIMLTWGGGNPTLEKLWPGITKYSGNGVYIDIDHPGTRELVRQVMDQLIPLTSGRPGVINYDLANEPFFYMDGWTVHTMHTYYAWLAKRHGSIESLNKAWNTSYETFKQIPPPKDRPRQNCSVGEWYDRVTFHNHRTASFFAFVASEIRRHDPDALIHTKGQDNNSMGPKPFSVTDGIDREMMTPSVDLHGLDTRPLPLTEPRMAVIIDPDEDNAKLNYDESIYSFHWLGQSFLYDYLTSLEPYRPIVDFEYHAFSINAIRVPDIGQGHARATLWLAHMHGMVGNAVWYWHRRYGPDPFPEKYFKQWFYGSFSTQPIVASEYFQTMLQLNMLAREITALSRPPAKPVRLFVSPPSYIQDQRHIAALHRAYEAVCFHDLPVGFVTENTLMNSGITDDIKMIVIPDAQYVSSQALTLLRRAKQTGVQLVRLGRQNITHDEYGFKHTRESVAFLEDIPVIDYASAPELAMLFGPFILPLADQLPVTVQDSEGQNAFGVMRRYANLDGRSVLMLVNLKPDETDVRLVNRQGKNVNGYDLLNHETVKGNGTHLPVKGVRLIELDE